MNFDDYLDYLEDEGKLTIDQIIQIRQLVKEDARQRNFKYWNSHLTVRLEYYLKRISEIEAKQKAEYKKVKLVATNFSQRG